MYETMLYWTEKSINQTQEKIWRECLATQKSYKFQVLKSFEEFFGPEELWVFLAKQMISTKEISRKEMLKCCNPKQPIHN